MLFGAAAKNEKEMWITLFESPEDDLYDGDFSENDPELPQIRVWFKKATGVANDSIVKTSTVITSQTTTRVVERREEWTIEHLQTELKEKLQDLIVRLGDDQVALFEEEEFRISMLQDLEKVHQELIGEHEEDKARGEGIRETLALTKKETYANKTALEEDKRKLLDQIKAIEELIKQTEKGIDGE